MRYFALFIALAAATLHAAALPTSADLAAALAAAESAWGVDDIPVEFRLEPIDSCVFNENVAVEQDLTRVTTMRFDDGSIAIESHEIRHIIRINSSCDWSRLNLNQIVLHEFGHVLVGPSHSGNKRSIMYPVVMPGQRITPQDRARAQVALLRAAL